MKRVLIYEVIADIGDDSLTPYLTDAFNELHTSDSQEARDARSECAIFTASNGLLINSKPYYLFPG